MAIKSMPPLVLAPDEAAELAAFFTVLARPIWVADGELYWDSHSRYLLITLEKIWLKIVETCMSFRSKNSSTKTNSLQTASTMSLFYDLKTSSKWNWLFRDYEIAITIGFLSMLSRMDALSSTSAWFDSRTVVFILVSLKSIVEVFI